MLLDHAVERLGENGTLATGALLIGVVFGFMAQRSRFCLLVAVIEFARRHTGGKLTVWLFAFATAVGVTQALAWAGWLDASNARQIAARGSMSGAAIGVGLTVAGGWWFTYAMSTIAFDPHPIQSLSFTGPSSEVPSRVLFVTDKPVSFDLGLVPGVFLGAFLAAALFGELRLEGFQGSAGMRRYIAGAMRMGFGGMLAGGCAVGAGLSGAAVFTATSWVTVCAMWAAAALTDRLLDQRPIETPDQAMPGASCASSTSSSRAGPLAAVLAGCCLLLTGPDASAAEPMRAQRVSDTAWFVQGEAALGSSANRNFISNAGFVVTPQGVVVIDALGSPALAEELVAAIRQVTAQPVRYVIVTHYHADHVYGLQVFKALGAMIVAHRLGQDYLNSDTAQMRLAASRQDLFPWIDEKTRLVAADRWLDADTVITLGGESFRIHHVGPAHTPEDLVVFAERAGVLFAGDLVFRGRIPFVGQADSRQWIASLDQLMTFKPRIVVPGHGPISTEPVADLQLTRDYLVHLRKTMGEAASQLEPFEDAYAKADWSRFEHLPLFRAANRMNAYNTYLLLEQQGPQADKP